MLFKDLEPGDSFLKLEDVTFPDKIQNRLIKISNEPWLVRLPMPTGYSKNEAQFNALLAAYPSIGAHIAPDTKVLLVK